MDTFLLCSLASSILFACSGNRGCHISMYRLSCAGTVMSENCGTKPHGSSLTRTGAVYPLTRMSRIDGLTINTTNPKYGLSDRNRPHIHSIISPNGRASCIPLPGVCGNLAGTGFATGNRFRLTIKNARFASKTKPKATELAQRQTRKVPTESSCSCIVGVSRLPTMLTRNAVASGITKPFCQIMS